VPRADARGVDRHQRRRDARRQLLEQGLTECGDLRIRGTDVDARLKEDWRSGKTGVACFSLD
jgi:hypothetical protein